MSASFEVSAFYRFARLPHYQTLQAPLEALCTRFNVIGIILLADEGINGTIAASPDVMVKVREGLLDITGLNAIDHKISYTDEAPFLRMKVRLKKEIVTIGDKSVDPLTRVGTYVEPEQWTDLISDPDTVVIDTRNAFEVSVGAFKGALDPQTRTFGEFPDFVRKNLDPARHKKIAMYCTGGIRCEKATSFMLQEGFEEVFHLKGGILKYLEDIPEDQSLWQGACFVFDRRVAVEHGLKVADFEPCHGCRAPLTPDDMGSPLFEEGVCCPHCAHTFTDAQKASSRERHKQVQLAAKRGEMHLGPAKTIHCNAVASVRN
jgi:UPF0176 protein